MGGRSSNVILDPTLALIRAQLRFRIQVRAECGNKFALKCPSGKIKCFKTMLVVFNGKPGHRGPTQPAYWKIPLTLFFFETVPNN